MCVSRWLENGGVAPPPCPVCGETPVTENAVIGGTGWYYASCRGCQMNTDPQATPEEAWVAWNRWVDRVQLQAENRAYTPGDPFPVCPGCGHSPVIKVMEQEPPHYSPPFYVECSDCELFMGCYSTPDQAWLAWNRWAQKVSRKENEV